MNFGRPVGNLAPSWNKTIGPRVLSPERQLKGWTMSEDQSQMSWRNALKCLAYGGAGTLFALSGCVFTPSDLAMAADDKRGAAALGKPLFVQISDTHIGFSKDANPDVNGTLTRTILLVIARR